jgi:REP element-mobilizing transposase RayT
LYYPGAKYHIVSRGNGRQQVFFEPEDYERFLEQLDAALEADEVILYAYCLMPNHYHLFLETPRGNVKRFMQRLNTAYSMYFRYKRKKPGHCFQGRYGAKVVNGDAYILGLSRYIHLNPVRVRRLEGATDEQRVRVLREYRWSSYAGYVWKRRAEQRVSYRWLELMGRVRNRTAYRGYVEGAVGKEDKGFLEALQASRYAIGDEKYREQTAEELRGLRMSKYVRDIVWPEVEGIEPAAVEQAVAAAFDVSVGDLHAHGQRAGLAKAVAVTLACELGMKPQRAIARHFGYGDESSVGKQRARLRTAMTEDRCLRARVEKLRKRLARG